MDLTPLEALRALGITDDEIRARAAWLPETIEQYEQAAEEAIHEGAADRHNPVDRLNAAVLRAAEQLGPERTPVTRETPLGTEVRHRSGEVTVTLVGWKRSGEMVTENDYCDMCAWDPDGWYVVEGDR